MSADRPTLPDEGLLRDLEAFGLTLEHEVSAGIRGNGVEELEILPGSVPPIEPDRPPLLRWWAGAAAAAALILVATAVVLTQQDFRIGSADDRDRSLGSVPDAEIKGDDDGANNTATETTVEAGFRAWVDRGPATIFSSDGVAVASVEPGQDGEPSLAMEPGVAGRYRSYVEAALGQLLGDPAILTAGGWSAGLSDGSGGPLTVEAWLSQSGLAITTNLNREMSDQALSAVAEFPVVESGFEAMVITVEPASGNLVVFQPTGMDGVYWYSNLRDSDRSGSTYQSSPLDPDAWPCCPRSPGSAFKPIVLATAFEQGYSAEDQISASGPCRFVDSTADNGVYHVGGSFQQAQSLAAVTRASNNCAFVRLGSVVGNGAVVAAATDLGLTTLPDDAGQFLSLPLGPAAVDWLEITAAYGTFAAEGRYLAPTALSEISAEIGGVLWRNEATGRQVLKPQTAHAVTQVLESVVEQGTGGRARLQGHHIAGKTGTTQNHQDAWFIGYSRYFVTSVWIGDVGIPLGEDDPAPIVVPGYGTVFGGEVPAQIWSAYMAPPHTDLPAAPFTPVPPLDREPRLLVAEAEVVSEIGSEAGD